MLLLASVMKQCIELLSVSSCMLPVVVVGGVGESEEVRERLGNPQDFRRRQGLHL